MMLVKGGRAIGGIAFKFTAIFKLTMVQPERPQAVILEFGFVDFVTCTGHQTGNGLPT
jgi:hypothetical protein